MVLEWLLSIALVLSGCFDGFRGLADVFGALWQSVGLLLVLNLAYVYV